MGSWVRPGDAVEPVLEADAVPVDGRGHCEPVDDVDGDRGPLRHLDEGTRILAVEAVHGERPAPDGTAHQPRFEVEGAAVAEPDDLARAGGGGRLYGRGQERVDGRSEAADPRHHRHRRMHGGTRPAARGRRRAAPDHPGHRQQVLRLHAHAGGDAPQHDASVPRGPVRHRLGGDEHEELVEVDGRERGAAVGDRPQVDHRPQARGGGPGHIAAVVAERRRIGQAGGVQGQVEAVTAAGGDRGAERRGRRREFDVARDAGEVGSVNQLDAVQVGVGRGSARVEGGTPEGVDRRLAACDQRRKRRQRREAQGGAPRRLSHFSLSNG